LYYVFGAPLHFSYHLVNLLTKHKKV